jgi:uncharacterized protein (DUF302 family)
MTLDLRPNERAFLSRLGQGLGVGGDQVLRMALDVGTALIQRMMEGRPQVEILLMCPPQVTREAIATLQKAGKVPTMVICSTATHTELAVSNGSALLGANGQAIQHNKIFIMGLPVVANPHFPDNLMLIIQEPLKLNIPTGPRH